MARGVHLRAVYQDSPRDDGPTPAYAQWTTGRGGPARSPHTTKAPPATE